MGCASSKSKGRSSCDAEGFANGSPKKTFPYDEKTKCTVKGNGLLFRLSNSTTKQWAFYNDSKTLEFHVMVTFSPHCRITAIGNTTLVALPKRSGYVAKTVVSPCETAEFVEGDIDGFDAVYQAVVISDAQKGQKRAAKKLCKRSENGGDRANAENE